MLLKHIGLTVCIVFIITVVVSLGNAYIVCKIKYWYSLNKCTVVDPFKFLYEFLWIVSNVTFYYIKMTIAKTKGLY